MRRNLAYGMLVALYSVLLVVAPARAFIISPNDPVPWLTTASGSRSGKGVPATITWSLIPDGTSISTGSGSSTTTSNLFSFMNTNFGGSPASWLHIFSDAFGRWNQLGGVNFVYEPHDDGVFHPSSNGALNVRGDIRLGGFNIDGADGTLAFTYVPTGGSDMAIDTSDGDLFKSGANLNYVYYRNTLMHEIGHSFGLEHVSSSSNLLMAPFIDDSANPIDGPQLDEVRGVQYFFGDVNEKANNGLGNGAPARATVLGTIAPGSTKTVGAAADVPTQAISPTATDFVSISNLADMDYYSFNVAAPSVFSATLTPRGGVFTQGAADQNQTPTTFNANARDNLTLTLLSTNGTTVLSTSNVNPAGGIESIANLVLPVSGAYFARVSGSDDTVQLYELALTATPILLGDFNKNGVVDAADYSVWRETQGQSVAIGTGADGNFDGQITAADFSVWRSHFGQVAGAGAGVGSGLSAAVPEPSIGGLVLLGMCGLASASARGRRI